MPRSLAMAPRTMFPPPITSPSETPHTVDRPNLVGDFVHDPGIDSEAPLSGKRLSRELQDDTAVARTAPAARGGRLAAAGARAGHAPLAIPRP